MLPSIQALRQMHAQFAAETAAQWVEFAHPFILAELPQLSSSQALGEEGFQEALMGLRDELEDYNPENPEATAFEICDRLADVLDYFPE